ncbi:MAG: DUF2752 domain-containing protein [Candidatus Nanopelagicales bacterium]
MDRWKRMRAPIGIGALGLVSAGYVYAVDPSSPGHYPPCPTKVLTGWDCPFCGSLRATHDALHANIGGAVDLNVLTVVLVLPAILVVYLLWSYRRWRGEELRLELPTWATSALIALFVAFTVVRNLPGMPFGTPS